MGKFQKLTKNYTVMKSLSSSIESEESTVRHNLYDLLVIRLLFTSTHIFFNISESRLRSSGTENNIIDFQFLLNQLFDIEKYSVRFGCRLIHVKMVKEKQNGLNQYFI